MNGIYPQPLNPKNTNQNVQFDDLKNVPFHDFMKVLAYNDNSRDEWEILHKVIESQPSLLYKTRNDGITLLWRTIRDISTSAMNGYDLEERLKLALKMIELAPRMDVNAAPSNPWYKTTVLEEVLKCKTACASANNSSHLLDLRKQLLMYLLLCGATIPRFRYFSITPQRNELEDELEGIRDSLIDTFASSAGLGLEILKMKQVAGNVFANPPMPQEVTRKIALEAVYVTCPWMARFPADFLAEKMLALLNEKYPLYFSPQSRLDIIG